ncbi:hypothetical protein [Deinococcus hopiensis]|uniref:hypothetical protein n=1 Tax=Deinococcus hopiensis TaxID=309885 RepID=UPI001FEA4985|nr:hypothetical protein [Deinococcus hopiensis]
MKSRGTTVVRPAVLATTAPCPSTPPRNLYTPRSDPLERAWQEHTNMGKKRGIPTYVDTRPAHLANAATLKTEGLKSHRDQLPAALFKYKGKDLEGTCALYERAECVPLEQKPEAS